MKTNKRILALILAALMLAPLASCSEKPSDETKAATSAPAAEETETEAAEQTDSRIKPDIPETADFGGEEYKFLMWMLPDWANTVINYRDIYAEAINGETINDIVFNRNVKIQESYNVVISEEKMQLGEIDGAVGKAINAGDTSYSVVYPRLLECPGMYQKAYFHNLHNVPNIDFEKPWWDANCVDSLSTHGILYGVATSINVNDKDATAGIAFNKTIAGNNGLEDLYTLVREGKWTFDKFSELADLCDQDVNGDGKLDENNDVYGILGKTDVMDAFWHGAGGLLVTKDEAGDFTFSFGTEHDIDTAVAVVELMNQPWFYNQHTMQKGKLDDILFRQSFETGHGLFLWMRLSDVTDMRAGEAEFGILPTPKYEEAQDQYYSFVSQHTTGLLSIPKTVAGDTLSHLGVVLEAMAAESHYTLIPAYIEESLKSKYSRDAESADMLDIIISNRVFDPMNIYNFGKFADTFIQLGPNNNSDIASVIKRNAKLVNKNIERFNEKIIANEENQA